MNITLLDSLSNLNKNAEFKFIGNGNPKDISDTLGKLAEPSAELGGWDGEVDQTGGTKTWKTRMDGGICVQLVGSDSPNHDVPEDAPVPYPFLITRKAIASDVAFYGKDSFQFTMQNEGRFPRGEGSRRVVTRQMCLKYGAMEEPVWQDSERVHIGGCDASYAGVGGDRSIFCELQFGRDVKGRQIIALVDTLLIPVEGGIKDLPEEQIAQFCIQQCKMRGIAPENFFFDSTGRGSFALALGRLWSPTVNGIEFGGHPSDRPVSSQITTSSKDYYSKRVSELWFGVRHIIMAAQFRGMSEEVMTELICKEWKIVGANKTEVEPKDDTKVKVGRSPDLADALCVALEGARQRGFSIADTSAKVVRTGQSDWLKRTRERLLRLRKSHELVYR